MASKTYPYSKAAFELQARLPTSPTQFIEEGHDDMMPSPSIAAHWHGMAWYASTRQKRPRLPRWPYVGAHDNTTRHDTLKRSQTKAKR